MGEKPRAHMVRVYDEAMFGRLRVRAAEEGRTVGAVVENALRLYLGAPSSAAVILAQSEPQPPEPPVITMPRGASPSAVATLRELVRSVPAGPHQEPNGRPETAREKLEREAARREWLRTHPEEEGQ